MGLIKPDVLVRQHDIHVRVGPKPEKHASSIALPFHRSEDSRQYFGPVVASKVHVEQFVLQWVLPPVKPLLLQQFRVDAPSNVHDLAPFDRHSYGVAEYICQVQQRVTRMVVILPFEARFYSSRGVDAEFVGHPLAELPRPTITREEYAARHRLDPARQWISRSVLE